MVKKFNQKEIDLIYEQLYNEEEVLWRGKPSVSYNLPYLTTILFVMFILITFLIMRLISLDKSFNLFNLKLSFSMIRPFLDIVSETPWIRSSKL